MDFALGYLVQRFFYRFLDFFHHWYVDGSRAIGHRFIGTLESLDRTIALRVTVRYLFQPLYRDYTVIGRILGFIFRVLRILIGLVLYCVVAAVYAAFYVGWLVLPALAIFYTIAHAAHRP